MARVGKMNVTVTAPGLQEFLDRIEEAVGRLETLMTRVAIAQICGILEAARRVRA